MTAIIELFAYSVISVLLAKFFIRYAGTTKKLNSVYIKAAAFGFICMLIASVVEAVLPKSLTNISGTSRSALIGAILVGLIEECLKFIPYALYVYRKKYFNRMVDGVVLFVVVGLGAAFLEDQAAVFSDPGNLVRLPLILFHAATIGIAGYFLAQAKLKRGSLFKTFLVLLFVSFVHGLFDFCAGAGPPGFTFLAYTIAVVLMISLVTVYIRAKREDKVSSRK